MSEPKVHLEAGLFGLAACGKRNVDTAKDVNLVTCAACKATSSYEVRMEEQAGVVG